MTKQSKWNWAILACVVAVASGTLSMSLSRFEVTKTSIFIPPRVITEIPTDQDHYFDRNEDESGWKTYWNQERGFEVKHPSQFDVDEYVYGLYKNRYSATFESGQRNFFQVKVVNNEWLQYGKDTLKHHLDTEPIGYGKIDNLHSAIFYLPNGYCDGPGCSLPTKAHKVKKDNIVYTLTIVGTKEFIEENEDMFISSFKFIESEE